MAHSHPEELQFKLAEFAPVELEQITTLSRMMQRDWRQRGFLPKSDRHARFNVFEVVNVWVMKMFSDRGIGPARSSSVTPRIAAAIVAYVMSWEEAAWGGLTDEVLAVARGSKVPHLDWMRYNPQFSTFALTEMLFDSLDVGRVEREESVIWFPNDEVAFGSISNIAGAPAKGFDPRFDGAAIVLSIDRIAENLIRRLPRPVVEVAAGTMTVGRTAAHG